MSLNPVIQTSCVVCCSPEYETICTADEVRIQQEFLRRFHRRRLKPSASAKAIEDRAEFSQDYATNIVACKRCGLIFRNPRPPIAEIEQRYAADSYGRERLDSMFESQRRLAQPKVAMLDHWLKPDARVLEVGSFVGGFLAAGCEHGWDMVGVDPGEEVTEYCAGRSLRVFQGELADLPDRHGQFDCIAIWNTFDQLPDPRPTLEAARARLNAGGILAIRVPNGACFRSTIRRYHQERRRNPAMANYLLCVLAWNNLLTFPYLDGYSIPPLNRLMSGYGLTRIHAEPDVLVRLSDSDTKRWAAIEESAIKTASRLTMRLHAKDAFTHAPWLDLYYRRLV